VRLLAIAAGVVAFLAVSAAVARVIGAGSAARHDVVEAIERRAGGEVKVLRIDGVSGFAVTGRTETARVAWKRGDRLPVVQCVRVRRRGDPLSGYEAKVLNVSRPIDREGECSD
jgi:hypothetical protein